MYENTSNANLAARAIDLYKMDKGLGKYSNKQEKEIKKEAAKAVSKTKKAESTEGVQPGKIWSNSVIAKMNVREYAKHEEEIDKAVKEGRIQP